MPQKDEVLAASQNEVVVPRLETQPSYREADIKTAFQANETTRHPLLLRWQGCANH